MLSLTLAWPPGAQAGGLPEPDLVLYGTIRNISGGLNIRITAGNLNWTFQPAGGGKAILVTTTITNINDQFSYILRVPCEKQITGFAAAEGTLTLGNAYDRSQVLIDGRAATFAQSGQQNLALGLSDRGRIERVDLQISIGGSGLLPENWQLQYFGRTGIDPFGDPDQDGMDNLGEFRSGTNPQDADSVFEIGISENAAGGPRLRWSSVAGVIYTLRRSQDLLTGFQDLAINVAATPPVNAYQDGTASGPGPYFYRVMVKQPAQ